MEVNLKCVCELLINAKILALIECFKYIFTLFFFRCCYFLFFLWPFRTFPKRDNDSGVYLLDSTEANHGTCIGRSQGLHLFC